MPTLLVLQGPDKGRKFDVADNAPLPIGRASREIPLTDYTVSRKHAELSPKGRGWILSDSKSANGTYLNSKRLERPTRLSDGDRIRMGATVLLWDGSGGKTAESSRAPQTVGADLLELDAGHGGGDASIIGSVVSGDDSMILASPAAAEAVRSWRVISTLLDAVGAALEPSQIANRVLDLLFEEVPADRGFILLKDIKTGKFDMEIVRAGEELGEKIRASGKIVDHVIEHREGILCSNAMSDERFAEAGGEGLKGIGLRSVICAPLIAHEDVLGVLYVDSKMSNHIYAEEQLRLVAAIGQMAGLAIEDARLLKERMQTERLAAAGETVAALSHYIKNVLQGLKGGSEAVEMGLRGDNIETVDQGWEIVRRNLSLIFSLAMNMLAFAKRREPRMEMVQIYDLLQDVLKLEHPRAEEKGVLLQCQLDESVPAVPVDRHGVHQVAQNIIANAIDAVDKTTGVVNVKLNYDAEKEVVELAVGDNGPGIPNEIREKIFDPFYSTKGQGGTGLGLAVARKIVEEHGGGISVSSVEGEGTLIRVHLSSKPPGKSIDAEATHGPSAG